MLLIAKVMADGLLANPVMLNCYFFTNGLLEMRSPAETLQLAKEQFHYSWGLGLLVWTPVQIINFHFLPVHFQAAFVSIVNVGWKTTLSLLAHRATATPASVEADNLRGEVARLQVEVLSLQHRLALAEMATDASGAAAPSQPTAIAEARGREEALQQHAPVPPERELRREPGTPVEERPSQSAETAGS